MKMLDDVGKQIAEAAEQSGKNLIVAEATSESESVAGGDCSLTFTDCETKKPLSVKLKPGQTIFYGDWNGKICIRKQFTCPK
ncbi:MAG: hypothetical protein ICV60_22700 [Pyrinomonadaceae bacterium]|nr:hypothetical protein [Pyrinomonadaceae bacterium]